MVNQTDAFGNKLTYNPIGTSAAGNPRYEAVTTLSPEQKALADKLTGLTGRSFDTAEQLFGNVQGRLGTAPPEFDDTYRQQQLAKMLERQQPQLERDRQALLTELANSGATPGTPAYDAAMQQYNQRLNDLNIALDLQAGNEARADYGTRLGSRTQSINELTGLLGLGQVQGFQPQATPQTGVAPTDVIGAQNMAYQGALNNYNQSQANRRGMIGGLAGLGGAALGGWAQGGFINPFGR